MPKVVIPNDLRGLLLKSARGLHVAKAEGWLWESVRRGSWAAGILDALRSMCPSETVDLLEADYDRVVEGGSENP